MKNCKCGEELLIHHEMVSGMCMVCMQGQQMEEDGRPITRTADAHRPANESVLSDYMELKI